MVKTEWNKNSSTIFDILPTIIHWHVSKCKYYSKNYPSVSLLAIGFTHSNVVLGDAEWNKLIIWCPFGWFLGVFYMKTVLKEVVSM